MLCIVLCLFASSTYAQTTVSTNHTNNNGNGAVIFNVENTNTYDIIITDLQCHLGTSAANNVQLLYNTVPYYDNAAPWGFGTVGAGQNGWILAGSGTVNSNTANGVVTALSGLSLTIPAGLTYQLGFSATTLQYMTLAAGSFTFSGGGVLLHTGDGISWGGTAYPSTPGNYPRGFIGGITFIPAVPCTAPPTPGTVTPAANPICPSVNNTLSITGGTGGTGQTYQWQSSPDGISFSNIGGATANTYISNQTAATYYRYYVTCGGMTDTSAAMLVNMNSFMDCYCSSIPGYSADEEIYNVTVNGGSTDPLYSGANGCTTAAPGTGSILGRYSNFKTLAPITSALQEQTVSFSIDQDECDGATYYSNGIAIWIDFNQNGLFTDAGEQVFVEATTATGPRTVTGTFTIPATAITGNTVMRIIAAEGYSGGSLQPCLSYNYGETEDYLITINACPVLTGTDVQTACESYVWIDGLTYTNSNNTATFITTAANGVCDSTVTLNLTILSSSTGSVNNTICADDSIIVNGTTYNAANPSGTEVLTAANGCDSTVTINLNVLPAIASSLTNTICAEDSIIVNGTTYNAANSSGTEVLTAANGCDSTVTINLNVLPVIASSVTNTICAQDSIVVNGTAYNAANPSGTEVLAAANGCDSTVTINLNVLPAISASVNNTICAEDAIIVNGTTYNAANPSGMEVFTAANGCDSTVTINLNVLPLLSGSVNNTICADDSVVVNGTTYNAANPSGMEVFTAVNGCDSTVTINLVINTVNSSVSVSGTELTAGATGAAYQWIDCNSATPILTGETASSFIATVNGDYAVIVTENGCTDTSACFSIMNVGIENLNTENTITHYPNPVKDNITIASTLGFDNSLVKLIDLTGKVLIEAKINSGNSHSFDMSTFASGLYFIEINQNGEVKRLKVMKN
jgi:hypothetical protein